MSSSSSDSPLLHKKAADVTIEDIDNSENSSDESLDMIPDQKRSFTLPK